VLINSKSQQTINSTNNDQYLCSTIDTEGKILSQKIVKTEFERDEVFVSFYDVYGTFCYKIMANVKDQKASVIEYSEDRYGNLNGMITKALI
jgi:hypothetical protein